MTPGPVSEKAPSAKWRHDLKNQLGIVLGYSEMVLEDLDPANPMRADVEEILKAARQALTLLAQIEPVD